MERRISAALVALSLGWTVGAGTTASAATESLDANALPATYEQVESITVLGGFHDFDPLDERSLIVWASPSRPYLVELAFPSVDLRFAHAIGIESHTSRVHARFDSVLIRGLRYPIGSIYKLTREEARELRRRG